MKILLPLSERMNNKKHWILSIIVYTGFLSPVAAQESYHFDAEGSTIKCSIKYSLVGRYMAVLDDFEGTLDFDPREKRIRSVNLKIRSSSIKSRFSALDRIVHSRQLLHVERYPDIVFESTAIKQEQAEYSVTGVLQMHGVKREFLFSFHADKISDDKTARPHILARGTWQINRKDFNIIWSRWLDKGGILVGNYITVDWEIAAYRKGTAGGGI